MCVCVCVCVCVCYLDLHLHGVMISDVDLCYLLQFSPSVTYL